MLPTRRAASPASLLQRMLRTSVVARSLLLVTACACITMSSRAFASSAGVPPVSAAAPPTSWEHVAAGGAAEAGVPRDLQLPLGYETFSVQGRRPYQEDTYASGVLPNGARVFAVFDGHSGSKASMMLRERMLPELTAQLEKTADMTEALRNAYMKIDAEVCRATASGSTAVTAVLAADRKLYVANTGDSRVVLIRQRRDTDPALGPFFTPVTEPQAQITGTDAAEPTRRPPSPWFGEALTKDHKPDDPDEKKRIESLPGGYIQHVGVWRTQGFLAMSRAIGDRDLRPYVIPDPDVTVHELPDDTIALVLASDGLFEVDALCEAGLAELLHMYAAANEGALTDASKLLTAMAVRSGSFDNVTVTVVDPFAKLPKIKEDVADLDDDSTLRAKL